ncbi:MAG: hypothetical protein IH782_07300 [candidate division NC10 bacterium]|nr:hypothetical protein [candidate division NC10 bacterium]
MAAKLLASVMYLLLLLLLAVSVFCIAWGLWRGYRDRHAVRPDEAAVPTPPDEDVLIFDRVTDGLSQIPNPDDPRALWAAHKEVMQSVGEQYGLKSAQVGVIYWRVWQWKHGIRW